MCHLSLCATGLMLVAAAVAGCVTVPLPVSSGPLPDSRTNVPQAVPSFIRAGHTTRREVLLGLGEPDGAGPEERWYSYGSATSHGGVAALTMSYGFSYDKRESVEYRRLLVRFDDSGLVSAVTLESKRCPLWDSSLVGYVSVPCLDIRGSDIREQSRAADLDEHPTVQELVENMTPTAKEPVLAHYNYVIRRPAVCPVHGTLGISAADYPGKLQILPGALQFSVPAHGQTTRSAFIEHPTESFRVPIAQVESVDVIKGSMRWRWVNLHMKDGTCTSVQFSGFSDKDPQEAAQLIRQQIDHRN